MGRLTTHVLDTARGCPATSLQIDLYHIDGVQRRLVKTDRTNADGRLDSALLEMADFQVGTYELIFQAGDYFRRSHLPVAEPAFIDEVVIRFGMADANAHYHVPLLVSPWSYSTYRGS